MIDFFSNLLQIPDVRAGDDIIDAVVIDEEAVGSEAQGSGAKILYGKGALDHYLSQNKAKEVEVRIANVHVSCQLNPNSSLPPRDFRC